jgi:transposase
MKRNATYEIKGPGGTLRVRPDDSVAIDLAMLIEGETSGRPLDEVLAVYGRSRSTYYEKLRRFRSEGIEGLHAKPPGPRAPWRRPLEIQRFVVSTRIRHPEQSAADIAASLERLGHRISIRSVERTLSQFGVTRSSTVRAGPCGAALTPVPGRSLTPVPGPTLTPVPGPAAAGSLAPPAPEAYPAPIPACGTSGGDE